MKINKKGTTIVELLVYMGLLSIFLVLLINILVTTLNFRLGTESSSAINQDLRFILSKLSYEIYNADDLTIPATLGATSGSVGITTSGGTKTFSLDANNDLIETSGGVSTKLNGTDTRITNLSFERIGTSGESPTVKINITVEGRINLQGGLVDSETAETTYGLR
jgi:hypothetical protein